MNFGAVQGARTSWESSSGLLGGFGLGAKQISQANDVIEGQLRGERLTMKAGGIGHARAALYLQELSRKKAWVTHKSAGGWLHSDAFPQQRHADIIGPRFATGVLQQRAHLTGPVQFFKKLLDTWKLDSTGATALLGMDPDDWPFVRVLLAGRVPLKGRDAKDRIAHLYRIRKILSALFRDETVENQWLREPHAMLDERSPLELMLDGSMENLLLVKEYVEAAAGR